MGEPCGASIRLQVFGMIAVMMTQVCLCEQIRVAFDHEGSPPTERQEPQPGLDCTARPFNATLIAHLQGANEAGMERIGHAPSV